MYAVILCLKYINISALHRNKALKLVDKNEVAYKIIVLSLVHHFVVSIILQKNPTPPKILGPFGLF